MSIQKLKEIHIHMRPDLKRPTMVLDDDGMQMSTKQSTYFEIIWSRFDAKRKAFIVRRIVIPRSNLVMVDERWSNDNEVMNDDI